LRKQNTSHVRGFAAIEILLALTVIILVTSTTVLMAFDSGQLAIDTEMSQEALYKTQILQENARAKSRKNWNNLASVSNASGIYTENTEIKDLDDYIKLIKTSVLWDRAGKVLKTELSTVLTNWQEMGQVGRCSYNSTKDWLSPTISKIVDLGILSPATDVDVKNGIAYVTADGNSTAKDFFVVDTTQNPPNILFSIDTGPGVFGLNVVGKYAYLANTSINSQLQIVNLNSYSVINYEIPGSGTGDTSTSIYYYDKKIYLGLPSSSIPELHIIDVEDLYYIHEVGKWDFNFKVNDIYVSNGFAYIATPDNTEEMKVLAVQDPDNIVEIPGFDAPGSSGNGKSIGRKNGKIFLGRSLGNIELYVMDIDNINTPITNQDINSSVNDISIIGDYVFLATTDTTKELQIFKILSNPTSLVLQSSLDLPAKATSVDCEDNNLYITTDNGNYGLLIIDSGT
jgi:hypothetical protein